MTMLNGHSETCEECTEHNGTHCRNSLSDHHGHGVAFWHPACKNIIMEINRDEEE
jgi:hypothetical protein